MLYAAVKTIIFEVFQAKLKSLQRGHAETKDTQIQYSFTIREPLNEHIFKKWAQPAINAFYKYYLYQLVVPNMDILIGYFKLFDSKESVTQAENEYYREQVKQSEQAHLTVIARDII
ncbi:unnamed protein product [Rotaria sp. Silwood2]|nr:unnamed protein product [Rotaria sp. Silwood2]CAF3062691.1 unnamed protein product [Rotaria sp. Silwood2]CAF4485655.1 unnamed protein product [Rotaria sp. Silwood2]